MRTVVRNFDQIGSVVGDLDVDVRRLRILQWKQQRQQYECVFDEFLHDGAQVDNNLTASDFGNVASVDLPQCADSGSRHESRVAAKKNETRREMKMEGQECVE